MIAMPRTRGMVRGTEAQARTRAVGSTSATRKALKLSSASLNTGPRFIRVLVFKLFHRMRIGTLDVGKVVTCGEIMH